MLIKSVRERDTQGKNRLYNHYRCNCCNTEFRKQARFAGSPREHFCSQKCFNSDKYKQLTCPVCNSEFSRLCSNLRAKSNIYFCSRECKDKGQSYIKEIQPSHYNTTDKYRDKALRHNQSCNRCGYDKSIHALVVHHIDKNRENNSLSNLEVLCANCHALEHWA